MDNHYNVCAEFDMQVTTVYPKGNSLNDQVIQCIEEIKNKYYNNSLLWARILKIQFFVRVNTNQQYREINSTITNIIHDRFGKNLVPFSILSQKPLPGKYYIVAEITFFQADAFISSKNIPTSFGFYRLIESDFGVFVSACGLGNTSIITNILEQSVSAFEQMKHILQNEQLHFNQVIRQWNYIENITGFSEKNQHYQIFNDVRTMYFSESKFTKGYPAATGIGINHGGVIIDFIAFKPKANVRIESLKSPVQIDAHQYSEKVLSNNSIHLRYKNTTPKFERGKLILALKSGIIFVSGTAAIRGEHSIDSTDVAQQTFTTLENINQLTSKENLKQNGIDVENFEIFPIQYRFYLKNESDYETVENVVKKINITVPINYVQADVCRTELLIEIEAIFGMISK